VRGKHNCTLRNGGWRK